MRYAANYECSFIYLAASIVLRADSEDFRPHSWDFILKCKSVGLTPFMGYTEIRFALKLAVKVTR
jgi:hypothetical protein